MKTADVIVIGAGIAGASVAYELARNLDVLLVEAESVAGFHSTGRSVAMLVNSYGSGINQTLCRNSHEFFAQPPPGFTETELLKPRDVLWLARQNQLPAYSELMAVNPDFRSITIDEAIHRCPVLCRTYLRNGEIALDVSAQEIDVSALHQGFLRGFRQCGGTSLLNTRITSIERRSDSWKLESQDEKLECRILVNAAGAWADHVATLAGISAVGLMPKTRTVMTFPAPSGQSAAHWPFVVGINEDFYFKPEAGNILASPADESVAIPSDVQPEEISIARTVDQIERATTMRVSRIVSKWAGLRTFTRDRAPVVGWDPGDPAFFWLAGQGGSGIMTSPALARISARLIEQGASTEHAIASQDLVEGISPRRLRSTSALQPDQMNVAQV